MHREKLIDTINKTSESESLYCEECGKEVPADYYGVEIRAFCIYLCPSCARSIGNKLIEVAQNLKEAK